MPFKTRTTSFDLQPTSIDEASEWCVENMADVGVGKQDRLRVRLMVEQALMDISERHGEYQEVSAFLEKHRGRLRLRLTWKGSRFNPLGGNEDEQDEWSSSFFTALGMRAQYAYSMGGNVLRIPLPKRTLNPILRIIIAIAVAVALGMLGNLMVPDSIQETITDMVLGPIADMWVRLLQAVSGPVIFFTALTGALGTKRISDYGGSRFVTIARYFVISVAVVVVAMICSMPFFPLEVSALEANRQVLSNLLSDVLQIVPGNLFEPFSTANTPQLLLIAIIAGYVLAALDTQVAELKTLVQQLNLFGLTMARLACTLTPYFAGLLLFLRIWSHKSGLLWNVWLPLVLSIAISVAILALTILVASARLRINPLLLASKLKDTFLKNLKSGTLDFSSIDDLAQSCKRLLGINSDFAKATLPQGLVLYMPTSAVGIWVFIVFTAQAQQMNVDYIWLLTAAFLTVVLAVATPPVTGANLLAFIAAFSYLGISNDAILDVMIFDIVFGVVCTAIDQTMLQIETTLQAGNLGFLNEDRLRAPLPS